jgi:hypothetical protein
MVWGHGGVFILRFAGGAGCVASGAGFLRLRGEDHLPVKSVLTFSK